MDYNPDAYDILLVPPGPFHATLREFIASLWGTQQSFAFAGRFTTSQVSRWCSGEHRPTQTTYNQIEDLIRARLEEGEVTDGTIERVINRLRVSYHAPATVENRKARLEDRAIRTLNEMALLYPQAVGDTLQDGLYAMAAIVRAAYEAGYNAALEEHQLPAPRKRAQPRPAQEDDAPE